MSLSTGGVGTTGITVETPTDGRGQVNDRKKKHKNESEWIGIHSMKSACIVSKSGPWLVGRNVL